VEKINIYGYGAIGRGIEEMLGEMDIEPNAIIDDSDNGVTYNKKEHESVVLCMMLGADRKQVVERHGLTLKGFISPDSKVSKLAKYDPSLIALNYSIVQRDTNIGYSVFIDVQSTIGHDTVIKDYVSVGPHVIICANCVIGEGAFIGAGAVLLPNSVVGAGSIIGANATVKSKRRVGKNCVVDSGVVVNTNVQDGAIHT